jgi:hypothetical protein
VLEQLFDDVTVTHRYFPVEMPRAQVLVPPPPRTDRRLVLEKTRFARTVARCTVHARRGAGCQLLRVHAGGTACAKPLAGRRQEEGRVVMGFASPLAPAPRNTNFNLLLCTLLCVRAR